MAHDTNCRVKLPEDLLTEIFFRSSVKSLLCAKCVCKSWYALIQNPEFVLDHLHYNISHNKGHLFLQYFKEDTHIHNYALFDDETLDDNKYHVIDQLEMQWYPLHMEGPINGLYCLYSHKDRIALWNPVLMETKTLPIPHPHFLLHVNGFEGYIGFGIDSRTHDYKLVLIRMFDDEYSFRKQRYVTIYNLTSDSWTLLNLGDFHLHKYWLYENENSSFINGCCHWWTKLGVVIAFDMKHETFRQILGPDLSHLESSTGSLTIYNNKLSLMIRYEYSIDTWVMVEKGVWTKQFSVTSLPRIFFEVGLWKNDGLFLAMDGYETPSLHPNFQMVLFDSKTQEMRVVGPKGMPMCFRASIYYESLVSLEDGTEKKGKKASLNTVSDFLMPCYNPYYDEKGENVNKLELE